MFRNLLTNSILSVKRLAAANKGPILLDSACKAELRWWREALTHRNGVSFLEHKSDVTVAMDASGHVWAENLPGLAGFNFARNEYWHGPPPPQYQHLDICDLKTLCHVVSCHLWAPTWNKNQILGQTDNMVSFCLFSNGRSRNDFRLRMARFMASQQVEHEFVWTLEWISTHANVIPDAL